MSRRRTLRRAVSWATTVLTVVVLTGCGAPTDTPDAAASTSTRTPTPTARASGTPTRAGADREVTMQIEIRVGAERFTATVDDTPAGRDLLAQLPQTIAMSDHGGVEKTGPLREPLDLDGQPDGADPDVGDLGYYAPGNDLVLYYGDQSYYTGIVILGRLDETAPSRLAAMDGGITASVTDAS
jgi:hypothetical protein